MKRARLCIPFPNIYTIGSGNPKVREAKQWWTHGAALAEFIEETGVKTSRNHTSKHKRNKVTSAMKKYTVPWGYVREINLVRACGRFILELLQAWFRQRGTVGGILGSLKSKQRPCGKREQWYFKELKLNKQTNK